MHIIERMKHRLAVHPNFRAELRERADELRAKADEYTTWARRLQRSSQAGDVEMHDRYARLACHYDDRADALEETLGCGR